MPNHAVKCLLKYGEKIKDLVTTTVTVIIDTTIATL